MKRNHQRLSASERMLAGALAGVIATVLMDAAGTLFWQRAMNSKTQKREREVEPRFPLAVLGERIARTLPVKSVEKTAGRLTTLMHWGIGIACGALHGLIEEAVPLERRALALPISAGMLGVDEFAFPAAGLCPWPPAFPWQTHARATFAHAIYGISVALTYEGMKSYLVAERRMEKAA